MTKFWDRTQYEYGWREAAWSDLAAVCAEIERDVVEWRVLTVVDMGDQRCRVIYRRVL